MVSIRKNFLKIKFKNTDQKDQMAEILLPIHILPGIIALTSAALTVSSEKGKKLHVLTGRTCFWGVVTIFLTAVLVVYPPFQPEWVWWLLPTALITPVIFWWNSKILR